MNVAASETFISTIVGRIVRGFQSSRVVLFGSLARGVATEQRNPWPTRCKSE